MGETRRRKIDQKESFCATNVIFLVFFHYVKTQILV